MTDRKDGYTESSRGQLFTLAPTAFDGVAAIPNNTFDATLPFLIARNRADAEARHSFRDLILRQIGAAGAPVNVGIFVDKVDRYVKGGTPIVPRFPNATNGVGTTFPKISDAFENPQVTASGAPARGTIQAIAGAQLVDTETFTLNDGSQAATVFEFDSGGGITGDVAVAFGGGDSAATVAAAIIAAINGVGAGLLIEARLAPGSTTLIDLTNEAGGVIGNVAITETVADDAFVIVGMAGGAVSTARLILNESMAAGDRVQRIFDLAEKAIIDSPGTVLIYVVTGGTTNLSYGLDVVNRT